MSNLAMRPCDQSALRALMAAEPTPGSPLPSEWVLGLLSRLIPADGVAVVVADRTGAPVARTDQPRWWSDRHTGGSRGRPLLLGVEHWIEIPGQLRFLAADGLVDAITIGFRNGADLVAQVRWDREHHRFTERDVAVARLITPLLQRLVRERPAPGLPACLTEQERRVLTHVAAGSSNTEIAADLFIAPGTVRKHLEHSYRKLGVRSRAAAVAALQGRDLPELDLRERLDRMA